jgi:segregation and condensation protein B
MRNLGGRHVMRLVTTVPAQRLGSVCQRYRRVTMPRNMLEGARREYWGWAATKGERADASGDTRDAKRMRLETILFLAREPINSRKLAHHARLADGTEARTLIRQLNRMYDQSSRAFRVEEVAGGFRLLTRQRFARWLRRLDYVPPQERLSAPAMETLAVVAYRQPVPRADIESIRGVSCGEILRQLMDRDLVRIGGRGEELGRPYLYTTTKRFLQLFGLQNLDELPRAGALRDASDSADLVPAGCSPHPCSATSNLQEQEKSEVIVTSHTQMPVDKMLRNRHARTTIAPQCGFDEDFDEDDYDDLEDDDLEDDDLEDDDLEDDDLEEDDLEEDDLEEDDLEEDDLEDDDLDDEDDEIEEEDVEEDDGFEEEEWEEVEDEDEDEDEDEEDWDEEEDWDDEFDEDEDVDSSDDEEDDEEWE